jgi:hypothetical protein
LVAGVSRGTWEREADVAEPLYSKRWTIEPSFRDSKDLRFGMGMSVLRINDPRRRDHSAGRFLTLPALGDRDWR